MKNMTLGLLVVALMGLGLQLAYAEGEGDNPGEGDRHAKDKHEGEPRDGAPDATYGEWLGTFEKSPDGTLTFKANDRDGEFLVVIGERASDEVKTAYEKADTVLIGKGTFGVRGLTKKDANSKDWLALNDIRRKEGDGKREGGGRDRDREGRKGGHKPGR